MAKLIILQIVSYMIVVAILAYTAGYMRGVNENNKERIEDSQDNWDNQKHEALDARSINEKNKAA